MNEQKSEEIKILLKNIVDHYDKEDQSVRQRQVISWRRLKLYWNSFSNIYFDAVAHDWRIFDYQTGEDNQNSYYDKNVNVFKAYLESIIAALSVTIPSVECFPEDAENDLDLSTAKAGNKIREKITRDNDVALLWLHALYIYATEGLVCCYHYMHESEEYGVYKEPKTREVESITKKLRCPSCNIEMPDDLVMQDEIIQCPSCGQQVTPILSEETITNVVQDGFKVLAKSKPCIEVYGGLNVKVPNYSRTQKDVPSLELAYEVSVAEARELYKDDDINILPGSYNSYEAWARLSPQYRGEFPQNVCTIRKRWMRPCAFYNITDDDQRQLLLDEYPNGVCVHLVNDEIVKCESAKLDEDWTLSYNPLSDYLHHDPLGTVLVNIQDVTNDLISLIIQTIEHGIPQTFADPQVLNFDDYRQTEVTPGGIFPAKARSGKTVAEGFYEVKTSQLSGEVLPFLQQTQELGQLASGATPSLYGGAQPNSSKTAAQYTMSNANARQRLNTSWKTLSIWWKNIFGKVIPAYINTVHEDEKFVKKGEDGSFINVFIRKAELEGKIGRVELETSEELPTSWAQIRDTIINIMSLNNPIIMQALMSPENLPMLTQAIGLNDVILPGENDRQAELAEIAILINAEPLIIPPAIDPTTNIPLPDEMGMPQQEQKIPSIDVDPIFDNHRVRFEVIKNWVTSEAGRLAKIENPKGYENVLLHGMGHYNALQQQAMLQAQNAETGSIEETKSESASSGEDNG